jgi:acetyl esterase/lipase
MKFNHCFLFCFTVGFPGGGHSLFGQWEGLEAAAISDWESVAVGRPLKREAFVPEGGAEGSSAQTVVYLFNLAAPRVGRESDAAIVGAFLEEGYQVIAIDYEGSPESRQPFINADILKVREEVLFGSYDSPRPIDQTALFIVPSGHRVRRDVLYDTGGLKRGLDIVYPTNPAYPAGALLEFSCDNAERMGNYSMVAIRDSLLEGAATEGHAVAMADHPWAFGYAGIDPMPDSARRAKAAVRALRAVGPQLGLSGDIVTMGFSRGSGVALMTATTFETDQFDAFYANQGVDASIQGAVIFAGRFSYTDLLPEDEDMGTYVSYWGPIEQNYATYEAHSALSYLQSAPAHPFFLSINSGEEADAQNQMQVLRNRLTELGATFTYLPDMDGAGHKLPIDADLVTAFGAFLGDSLWPDPGQILERMRYRLGALPEMRLESVEAVPPGSYAIQEYDPESGWLTPREIIPNADGVLNFAVQQNHLYRVLPWER